jgi:hypothetical protein
MRSHRRPRLVDHGPVTKRPSDPVPVTREPCDQRVKSDGIEYTNLHGSSRTMGTNSASGQRGMRLSMINRCSVTWSTVSLGPFGGGDGGKAGNRQAVRHLLDHGLRKGLRPAVTQSVGS